MLSPLLKYPLPEMRIDKSLLITFGVTWILDNTVTVLWTPDTRSIVTSYSGSTLNILGARLGVTGLAGLILTVLAAAAMHLLLTRTYFGKHVRAATEDSGAAALSGVNVQRTYLISCGIAAALAGVAGVVIVSSYSIAPSGGLNWLLTAMVVIVLAGEGSIAYILPAGLVLGLVQSISTLFVSPAYQQPIDAKTYAEVVELFDQMLRLMHPFTPFITEEIWQMLTDRKAGESIMISQIPKPANYNTELLTAFENVKEAISGIRKIRTDKNIAQKETMELKVQQGDKGFEAEFNSVVIKMGNLSSLEMVMEEVKGASSFMVKSTNFYIPLGGFINVEEELQKLEEELKYTQGFLNSVMKKLSNERFVSSAPEAVVALEKAKQADAEAKIKVLEERIAGLR